MPFGLIDRLFGCMQELAKIPNADADLLGEKIDEFWARATGEELEQAARDLLSMGLYRTYDGALCGVQRASYEAKQRRESKRYSSQFR